MLTFSVAYQHSRHYGFASTTIDCPCLAPSARIWYDTMTDKMNDLGFDAYKYDPGLWIHRGQLLVATTHVDDFQTYHPHRRCANLWRFGKSLDMRRLC